MHVIIQLHTIAVDWPGILPGGWRTRSDSSKRLPVRADIRKMVQCKSVGVVSFFVFACSNLLNFELSKQLNVYIILCLNVASMSMSGCCEDSSKSGAPPTRETKHWSTQHLHRGVSRQCLTSCSETEPFFGVVVFFHKSFIVWFWLQDVSPKIS